MTAAMIRHCKFTSLLLRIFATRLREVALLGGWAGAFGLEVVHRLVFLPGWRGLRVLARAARTGAAAASAPPALVASDRHQIVTKRK